MNPLNPEAANEVKTKYLSSVMEKMKESGGEDLTDVERSLASKYMEIERKVDALNSQANNMEKEIKFKTSQLEGLRDEIKTEFGRAGGIMDAMLALWEGAPESNVPGNGALKPDRPPEGEAKDKETTDA